MLINQVSRVTGLTRKAIEYYTAHRLVSPSVSDNGYRHYGDSDVDSLHKISVLRRLGIGIEDIRTILADESNAALQAAALRKELAFQQEATKKELFEQLAGGRPYAEIGEELKAVDKGKTVTEKLLDAFPGYYGRFICLHFARFLNEPIVTEDQHEAYAAVLGFLDTVPPLDLPPELEAYLTEGTKHIDTKQLSAMMEATKNAVENPDEYLADNKETLEQYLAFKQSDAYRNSPACRLMESMKEFNSTSGYNTVFIPAMKRLSPSYAAYYRQLERANEKLLARYPEISKLDNLTD